MKKWFECPDGQRVEIKECLEKCRMSERCAPLPYLQFAAEEREWLDKVSVTQCENGTRMEYLKIRADYAIRPGDVAFMFIGVRAHEKMIRDPSIRYSQELELITDEITGISDLVETQDNGDLWLIDYKTAGSFAVKKYLGVQVEQGEVFVNAAKADTSQYEKQPNMYRIIFEDLNPGKKIKRLKLFFIVRDGGLAIAKNRGITQRIYYVNAPIIDDEKIVQYYKMKGEALIEATVNDRTPAMCTPDETWGGERCRNYCPVQESCTQIGDNPHLLTFDKELVKF